MRDAGLPGFAALLPAALMFVPYWMARRQVSLDRAFDDAGVSGSSYVSSPSHVQQWILSLLPDWTWLGVEPDVGIAVDVTHATDCPGIDKRQRGAVSLGGGPVLARGPNVNPVVLARLRETAARHDIPVQIAALGRAAPNDANPLQVSRAGVATGLVQIPNRYMHSPVETVAWSDLEAAAELLAHFVCTVTADDSFVPA